MKDLILGIETSCDETGIALVGKDGIIAQALHSQIALHQQWGGVVPELASRDHLKRLLPMIDAMLKEHNIDQQRIAAIAYTGGPGLIGALLVGACVGAALATAWGIPAIPIHHLEGHLLVPMLDDPALTFPFVALLVSGGHSQIVEAKALGQYRILGQSIDDAVGEAFDKTAKTMGLAYPGGPMIEKLALDGDEDRFELPRPMLHEDLQMSFSGLKTAVVRHWQGCSQSEQDKKDLAASFQKAAFDVLVHKCKKALASFDKPSLVLCGGVAANQALSSRMQALMIKLGGKLHVPNRALCTDNGVMIAFAGYLRWQEGLDPEAVAAENIFVSPRKSIEESQLY